MGNCVLWDLPNPSWCTLFCIIQFDLILSPVFFLHDIINFALFSYVVLDIWIYHNYQCVMYSLIPNRTLFLMLFFFGMNMLITG